MSLIKYDLICDHCNTDYFIINRLEQDPTFCSYCGELLSIDGSDTQDEEDIAD